MTQPNVQQLTNKVQSIEAGLKSVLEEMARIRTACAQVSGRPTSAEISDDAILAASQRAEYLVSTAIREIWEFVHTHIADEAIARNKLALALADLDKDLTARVRAIELLDRNAITRAALKAALEA